MTAGVPGVPGVHVRTTLAVAAGTAPWESLVLAHAAAAPTRLALVRRCLDLGDLLALATTGTAQVALVAARLPGLDADGVERLRRCAVRSVVVAPRDVGEPERERLRRLGVTALVDEAEVATPDGLEAVLRRALLAPLTPGEESAGVGSGAGTDAVGQAVGQSVGQAAGEAVDEAVGGPGAGRVTAVWGPHGAPGRTTVAVALASEAAGAGVATTLVDADPHGGAVAQHLAVLDEASGLLAAVRAANAARLDAARLVGLARGVGERLRVLTGLPRPDRWVEVRPATLVDVLEVAAGVDPWVVVDAGSGLDPQADGRPSGSGRDRLVTAVLEHADDVVVVASADPVGLTRLARSLLEVREVRPGGAEAVVVNRMRPGLGWSSDDVVDMVARVAPHARVHFLPDDRDAADRALVAGRTLAECGESDLRRAVAALTRDLLTSSGLLPDSRRPTGSGRTGRRTRARVGHRLRRRQTVSSR